MNDNDKPAGISEEHRRKAARIAEVIIDHAHDWLVGEPGTTRLLTPDCVREVQVAREDLALVEALDRVYRGPVSR